MKKLYTLFLSMAFIPTVTCATPFRGGYSGLNLSYSLTNLHPSVKAHNLVNGKVIYKKSTHVHGNNVDPGFFLGFGTPLDVNNFYLGGELAIGHDRAHFKKNYHTQFGKAKIQLKPTFHYTASARLGYIICTQHLIYGRLGYHGYDKKVHITVPGKKATVQRSGPLFGVGVERVLANNLLLRGEYQFTHGNHKTIKRKYQAQNAHFKAHTNAHTHSALLGLVYTF
jgi:opacity protein-like surface antigen